jgi:hypothetical protein
LDRVASNVPYVTSARPRIRSAARRSHQASRITYLASRCRCAQPTGVAVSFHSPSRRSLARATLVAAALLAAACSRDGSISAPSQPRPTIPADSSRTIAAPALPNLKSSAPLIPSCGPTVEYKLTNLRYTVGTVSVSNDAEKLYVTYAVTADDWYVSDTRLAVAHSYLKIPQDRNKLPMPWSFPYAGVHEPPVKSHTFTLSLQQLGAKAGDKLVVAAMAGLVHPTTPRPDGPWEWLVMWGVGNVAGTSVETANNYTVAGCASTPTPPPPPLPSGSGVVSITFDDGWLETYTLAYPILKELGLRATVAANADAVDGEWSAYMNLAQLKELKGAGWSVVSHSLSHRDLTTLTDAELHRELRDSKAWIERNGFGPADVFIVPFHSWGARERGAVEQYYRKARGYSATQFTPVRMAKVPVTQPYDLTGYEPEFAPFTSPEGRAATMQFVERAVTEGEFIDIFFHHLHADQMPAFRLLMQDIAKYKANVRTWGQF